MNEAEERSYMMGSQRAWLTILEEAFNYLLPRVRELEAGLAKYGRHPRSCPGFEPTGYAIDLNDARCTCGLAALADGESS